jgi:hypothetical protein
MGQLAAGQQPGHGAVFQRHHLVGNARVDERLRAHDAARAAGAVHHHQRLGPGRELLDAVDQLGARQAVRKRQAEIGKLFGRAAVDHHDVVAALHARVQVVDRTPRRVLLVLDDLAEGLARHVAAAEQLVARGSPALGAAGQHRHVAPAQAHQLGGGLVRE